MIVSPLTEEPQPELVALRRGGLTMSAGLSPVLIRERVFVQFAQAEACDI